MCENQLKEVLIEFVNPNKAKELCVLEYKNHRFSPSFPEETVRFVCEEWTPRENDILIAAMTKCGNNWLCDIVRNIMYGRDPALYKISKEIPPVLLNLELGPKRKFRLLDKVALPRRYFFTNMTPSILPMTKFQEKGIKILYLMRNPKDRLLSWYHYSTKLHYTSHERFKDLFNKDWEIFFEDYRSGKQTLSLPYGHTYADNILAWLPYRNKENVKFLYFEDIKRDPHKEILDIADFIGEALTGDQLNEIVVNTDITRAKQGTERGETEDDKCKKQFSLIRTGKVGGWMFDKLMTPEKSRRIDDIIKDKLSGTGIEFSYSL